MPPRTVPPRQHATARRAATALPAVRPAALRCAALAVKLPWRLQAPRERTPRQPARCPPPAHARVTLLARQCPACLCRAHPATAHRPASQEQSVRSFCVKQAPRADSVGPGRSSRVIAGRAAKWVDNRAPPSLYDGCRRAAAPHLGRLSIQAAGRRLLPVLYHRGWMPTAVAHGEKLGPAALSGFGHTR